MNFFDAFFEQISHNRLDRYETAFREAVERCFHQREHGDMDAWIEAFQQLPEVSNAIIDNAADTLQIGKIEDLSADQKNKLNAGLRGLHPWRKGPFNFFGEYIDTEWRSDWKWQRLIPHISPLRDRFVLDVGCGSGYHCWRMQAEEAAFVLGIDPSLKFLFQFHAVKKYQPESLVHYLPIKSEDLPANMHAFDTVFSMGVLYHRRSTFDHIDELKSALKPGGELVLETLVIPGDENTVLTPADRYAQMRNVWCIGSAKATQRWIERCGFINVRIVDETRTSLEEQRQTDWMRFHSLKDFLDPNDPDKTLEGYPAPCRAIIVATKPG